MSSSKEMSVVKKAGIAGRIASVGHFVYRQFIGNHKDANEAYTRVYPTIKLTIQTYDRNSNESTNLLKILANLAPAGAIRRNFTKRYIDNSDGWSRLPKNPNDIPYGHWY
ncbi:hypothetical protein HH219_09815 [Pseudoalteromonas sp. NEC-BIFX-2020_015]|uniref:hypothetical protein n=1 Tax=Pseudoalteromonas sp. NEC-BIFX-2020_015 TaxID=2729544 RepID=UPI00146147F9|nr:hypothetical protein [Pseudoalteromonas sp. NEC-BIFX-2020_015]NMR25820.1 hypothetical protein [Pseudoalteromonas sp. NEC-BIFX-2020_015]